MVVGAGEVGSKVAERLSEYPEIEITLIERDPERHAFIQSSINCIHHLGSALDPKTLRSFDLASFDLFYAVTDSDEVNLLACQLAQEVLRREMERLELTSSPLSQSVSEVMTDASPCAPLGEGEARRALRARSESGSLAFFARVRSEALYDHLKHLSPHTNILLPEKVCSHKIDELIRYPQLFDVVELDADELKLYGVKVHPQSSLVGRRLCDLTEDLKITIAAMSPPRDAQTLKRGRDLLIPNAHDVIEAECAMYFAATPSTLANLYRHFSYREEGERVLAIAGESEVAQDVFQRVALQQGHIHDGGRRWRQVSIVADSEPLIKELERRDPYGGITALFGSITDSDMLAEIGVGPDATLLISSHDEENLICALLAREMQCERILIVNNREQYAQLIGQLGFDGIFSPRQLAVNEIVHQTLKMLSQSAYNVATGEDIEVRSFVISPQSELCGAQLKELTRFGFPREHAVIAAMIEPDSTAHVMPTGDDLLSAESVVYVVAHTSHFHQVKSLFGRRRSRFKLW